MKTQNAKSKSVKTGTNSVGSSRRADGGPTRAESKADTPGIKPISNNGQHAAPSANRLMELVTRQLFSSHWGVVTIPELPSCVMAFSNQGYASDKRARAMMSRFVRALQSNGLAVWLKAFSDDRYSWVMIIDTPRPEDVAELLDSAVNAAYGDEYYHLHSESGLLRLALENYRDSIQGGLE